jgi:hypothetical protein
MSKLIMRIAGKTLLNRKESYRQWFEFYKISLISPELIIQKQVEKTKVFYAPWGDIKNIKFEVWWKDHRHLFEEETVQVLTKDSMINFDDHVVLQIPHNQSVSDLLNEIKTILATKRKQQVNHRKNKNIVTSQFRLTIGSEPKLKTTAQVLNVYRDVHLKNPSVKGKKLLALVHQYYESRQRRNQIPVSLNNFGSEKPTEIGRVLKNLRRWISWGKQIQQNVLNCEFPGKYD